MGDKIQKYLLPIRMISVIILISCLVVFQIIVLSTFNFSGWIIYTDSLSLLGISLVFVNLIYIIQRYYHTNAVLNVPNISTILLFTFLTALINYIICATLFRSNEEYLSYLEIATPIKTILSALVFSIALMFFWIEQQKVQEERLKTFAIEKERQVLQIELNSLQQQFKPHFLFNSLNSINALTISNPEEARKMIHLLSEFMRGSIRKNDSDFNKLSDELHHIQLYTNIEKVRFGSRLCVDYDIPDEVLDCKLPSLILQPLIENSIKYGLYGHTDEVIITVKAEMKENQLVVSISNPFDETSSSGAKGTGYGLESINKKILILYKQSNLLEVTKKDILFTSTLKIPQQ